jgi:hypothetical protein
LRSGFSGQKRGFAFWPFGARKGCGNALEMAVGEFKSARFDAALMRRKIIWERRIRRKKSPPESTPARSQKSL